jgi:hypothetical protein
MHTFRRETSIGAAGLAQDWTEVAGERAFARSLAWGRAGLQRISCAVL